MKHRSERSGIGCAISSVGGQAPTGVARRRHIWVRSRLRKPIFHEVGQRGKLSLPGMRGEVAVYVHERALARTLRRFCCVGVVILSGCGFVTGLPAGNGSGITVNFSAIHDGGSTAFVESSQNDVFIVAESVPLSDDPLLIHGDIDSGHDVDVYDLGPVTLGDRVIVNMSTSASLNGAIGLFDATGAALLINDHRNVYLGRTEPFVDVVIRHESSACYVAVSSTPGYESVGDYALAASKEFGVEAPPPRPDVVLLVFDGGSGVRISSRSPVDVPAFDAANISSSYADETDLMVDAIVARIREDYAPYDVFVRSTSEGDQFEAGDSRIYFGTYDAALLGVAEGIDEFNGTTSQQAIVFTDTFRAMTRLDPTVEAISQAIANVASHEIGHLLGMVHTSDPYGVMDVTASLSQLLDDQVFSRSPIFGDAFPVGVQDAVRYLLDTVGGDEAFALSSQKIPALQSRRWFEEGDRTPARLRLQLSTCSLSTY